MMDTEEGLAKESEMSTGINEYGLTNDEMATINDMFNDLGITDELIQLALNDYKCVRGCFLLQGDQRLWLSCALYGLVLSLVNKVPTEHFSVRKPTLYFYMNSGSTKVSENASIGGGGGSSTHGRTLIDNNESTTVLSKMMQILNISLQYFFARFERWTKMIDLPHVVLNLARSIEASNNITYVIFQKYCSLFSVIFLEAEVYELVELRINKRKTRKRTCDPNELFHFIWFLFVSFKEIIYIINEFNVCYSLLLNCMKFVFINIMYELELISKLFQPEVIKHIESTGITIDNASDLGVIDFDRFFHGYLNKSNTFYKRENFDNIEKTVFVPCLEMLCGRSAFSFDSVHIRGTLDPVNINGNMKCLLEFYLNYRLFYFGVDESEYVKLKYTDKNVFVSLKPLKHEFVSFHSRKFMDNVVPKSVSLPSDHVLRNNVVTQSPDMVEKQSVVDHKSYNENVLNSMKQIIQVDFDIKKSLDSLLFDHGFEQLIERMENLYVDIHGKYNDKMKIELTDEMYWDMCLGLYHKIILSIVQTEFARGTTGEDHLKNFIMNTSFHRSVVAVCFDIFMYLKHSEKTFLWVCDCIQIAPFYLAQCIEQFIKLIPNLPVEIIGHLGVLEEEILSYFGWLPDSPIYQKLDSIYRKAIQEKNTALTLPYFSNVKIPNNFDYEEINVTSDKDSDIEQSVKYSDLKVVYAKPSKEQGSVEYLSVSIFYQRVYYIVLKRLNFFGIKMNLCKAEKSLIWNCIEFVLIHHTHLIRGHHIDQILMCSIYAVMRIMNRPVEFSAIINFYKFLSHARSAIYQNVPVSLLLTAVYESCLCIAFDVNNEDYSKSIPYLTLSRNKLYLQQLSGCVSSIKASPTAKFDESQENDTNTNEPTWIGRKQDDITEICPYIVDITTINNYTSFFSHQQLEILRDRHVDIVSYYNMVFAHVIQRYANSIAELVVKRKVHVLPLPVVHGNNEVFSFKVFNSLPLYVSPMKSSKKDNLWVPSATKSLNLTVERSPIVCRKINNFIGSSEKQQDDNENNNTDEYIHSKVKRKLDLSSPSPKNLNIN